MENKAILYVTFFPYYISVVFIKLHYFKLYYVKYKSYIGYTTLQYIDYSHIVSQCFISYIILNIYIYINIYLLIILDDLVLYYIESSYFLYLEY